MYVNPKGGIEFNGMNAEYMFYKHLLEKIGVEPQIFYDGKFKSATEPFRLDSMSKENKLMTKVLLDDIHSHVMNKVAESRKLPVSVVDSINNNFLIHTAYDAMKYHIADSILFVDQVHTYIRHELKIDGKDKINFISLSKYMDVPGKTSMY